jgi:hypothetical protein
MFSQLRAVEFFTLLSWIETVRVGSINNILFSSTTSPTLSINSSCSQCICMMLSTEYIVGVSCFQNQTCSLFYNYSRSYTLSNAPNSSFHFLTLPPAQEQSTVASIRNTETMSTTAVTTAPTTSRSLNFSASWNILGNIRQPMVICYKFLVKFWKPYLNQTPHVKFSPPSWHQRVLRPSHLNRYEI